ncbi:MAG: pyridoxal-phosphate dependent enzyme [Cyanobacteria bacterium SZAS LIN-5]|nr:pyridoxal-phosphate dependent enzyme [Cyanobacteria bacterium SZAS LIN-5]
MNKMNGASLKTGSPPSIIKSAQNPNLTGLKCLRCERLYSLDDPHIDSGLGCKDCLQKGFPVSLYCVYSESARLTVENNESGMHQFVSMLPYSNFPSIGEGSTGLAQIESLASAMGVASVAIKNEGQNPTGSHKDRMSPFAVARAISAGFTKVIASSSGNAGASLAAYAARAGLECCIISAPDISESWATAIKLTGAHLRLVPSHERWPLMQRLVQEENWFPVTNFHAQPIASNPFGIEGYKTVAYEIALQSRDKTPTLILIPTCRGDLLFGLYRGFVEAMQAGLIRTIPRLVAVEPGDRLKNALEGKDYRQHFTVDDNNMASIDGDTVTYQSIQALKNTEGGAICVSSEEASSAQGELSRKGYYVEMSSAASLAGLHKLKRDNKLSASDRVVLIATSHGYKQLPKDTAAVTNRTCN